MAQLTLGALQSLQRPRRGPAQGYRAHCEVKGKSVLVFHKDNHGVFREGTKTREKNGLNWHKRCVRSEQIDCNRFIIKI